MAIMDIETPIQFSKLNFSLKKDLPAIAEIIIIAVLFIANIIELSKNAELRANIKKYKDPKLARPRRTPNIKVFILSSLLFFKLNIRCIAIPIIAETAKITVVDSIAPVFLRNSS